MSDFAVCLSGLVLAFKLTNKAGGRAEEEDVSTVKWLSGYVNAEGRQEHSRGHQAQGTGKNMRHSPKSILIDPVQ